MIRSVVLAAVLLAGPASAAPVSHRLNTLAFDRTPLTDARIVEGRLVARHPDRGLLDGDELQGAQIEGEHPRGGSVVYDIARVTRDPMTLPAGYPYPPGATWLYELRYRDPGTGAWRNLCGLDEQRERWAIPLPGYYDDHNTAHPDPRRVTFACTRAVMAKCYRWGYRPWNGKEHAAAHQACIRMAMADYCGNGRSWTRDGTIIQRWDNLSPPVQARGPIHPKMSFEAAWTPRGAACFARPRWTGLAEDFRPEHCAKALPFCGSEKEAVRGHNGAGVVLFNASYPNRAVRSGDK